MHAFCILKFCVVIVHFYFCAGFSEHKHLRRQFHRMALLCVLEIFWCNQQFSYCNCFDYVICIMLVNLMSG